MNSQEIISLLRGSSMSIKEAFGFVLSELDLMDSLSDELSRNANASREVAQKLSYELTAYKITCEKLTRRLEDAGIELP